MSTSIPFNDSLVLPVIAAPMFLISGPKLVTECCMNGIVGTFPALNCRSTQGFNRWLTDINLVLTDYEQKEGKKSSPFGVNLIVHRSNPRLEADLDLCVAHKVPIIITSLGAATDLVSRVHDYGGLVYHDVIHKRHGIKAAKAGVDGLITVSAGAGGHAGTLNPIALVSEIKEFYDKTIILSGCLSNGQDVATAIQMGADLAYMGTRFINTKESEADMAYQDMIVQCSASDIVNTAAVSGINANFLGPSLMKAGFTEDSLKMKGKIDFGSELDVEKREQLPKAWKSIWSAGQGVTSIHDVLSVRELVARMKVEFVDAINRQSSKLSYYAM